MTTDVDLYTKLCDALMQLEEANEVILKVKRLNEIMGIPEEITENYIKKYGVENENI